MVLQTLSAALPRLHCQRREGAVQVTTRRVTSPKAHSKSPSGAAGRNHAQRHLAALPLVARPLGVRARLCAPVPGLGVPALDLHRVPLLQLWAALWCWIRGFRTLMCLSGQHSSLLTQARSPLHHD